MYMMMEYIFPHTCTMYSTIDLYFRSFIHVSNVKSSFDILVVTSGIHVYACTYMYNVYVHWHWKDPEAFRFEFNYH